MLLNIIRLPYIIWLFLYFIINKKIGLKPDICKLFIRLGPSFVKLGQTLSVRPDIVGDNYANQLAQLRDNMPPFSSHIVNKTIACELNSHPNDLFLSFNQNPVAAASIAQVHQAITKDGEKVAVKILRPSIEKQFKQDIKLFYFIARLINLYKPLRRLKSIDVVDTLNSIVRKELDLRLEAANACKLKENLIADKSVYIPKIYWNYTTTRVMVSEWIDAIALDDLESLKFYNIDLPKLAHDLYINFLNQVYRDGFFHADIHPGNIFIKKDGTIVPVDFGIMGKIDEKNKFYVAEILRGFITADYDHIARIHFAAGYVPKDQNIDDFALALRAIGEPIKDMPAKDISIATLLGNLFKTTKDFNMQTQTQLLLLQKTLILIEGICIRLNPEINLWDCARPWVKEWAKDNISLKAKAQEKIKQIFDLLNNLPNNLENIFNYFDNNLQKK